MKNREIPGVVVFERAGIWYPVHENAETDRLEAELAERARNLAAPHNAAWADELDKRYGPVEQPSRAQRIVRSLRRIF